MRWDGRGRWMSDCLENDGRWISLYSDKPLFCQLDVVAVPIFSSRIKRSLYPNLGKRTITMLYCSGVSRRDYYAKVYG